MHGGLQAHVGEFVCDVQPLFVLSADDQILEERIPRKPFRGSGVAAFIEVV